MIRARTVAASARVNFPPAVTPMRAGQVERDRGRDQPGGVGLEPPGGQVRQRAGLEVGDDLLDDRVPAVLGLGLTTSGAGLLVKIA